MTATTTNAPAAPTQERRTHKRFSIARPGKVHRANTALFAPARSRDLSFAGALLEVESERPFAVGEVLDIGIALKNATVLPTRNLARGIVVRSKASGENKQIVAIRYLHREPVADAA